MGPARKNGFLLAVLVGMTTWEGLDTVRTANALVMRALRVLTFAVLFLRLFLNTYEGFAYESRQYP